MLMNLRHCIVKTSIFSLILFILIFAFLKHFNTMKKTFKDEVEAEIPISALKFISNENHKQDTHIDINRISQLISQYNLEEKILNKDIYGTLKKDTIILVILLDKISIGFKFLLVSLAQVRGIEDALVIFSHSFFDENINSLIRTIDFCRVLQIFYPYSVQTHLQEFPGFHAHDCPHDIKMDVAEGINCTGAFFPDIHGRYRDPVQSERKHHWWWTANKIFENLACTVNHNGLVIFLEGDYFFMEDFIYMALYMKNMADLLPQCEFISLGAVETNFDFNENTVYSVEITTWDPRHHSNVLAFDLSVWNSIVSHYDLFCSIDDFSWSHSLYYVSLHRKEGKRYRTIASIMPRVFQTNPYGLHESSRDCDVMKNVFLVMNLQKKNYVNLFPSHLELYINIELELDAFVIFDYGESNGGWSDPRDVKMCRNMTVSKIKHVLLDMSNEFHNYIDDE